MEEYGVEGFEIVVDIFFEEDGVEAFGSLNVNFEVCSIFKSFKRDLGIHIAFDFPFNALEHNSSTMGLGIHIFFDLAIW